MSIHKHPVASAMFGDALTAPDEIVAAVFIPASSPNGGAVATTAPNTYDWRTEDCECDGGTTYATDAEGYYDKPCDRCEGDGEVTAACVECGHMVPLNGDGECEKCTDAGELSLADFAAKYHPRVAIGGAL